MCLCLFDDSPVEGKTRTGQNQFKTGMKDAPCNDPLFCIFSCLCMPCSNCFLRYKAIDENMDNYICCQGHYDCNCFKAGSIGDQGNPCCLAIEGLCCSSCAVSATRMHLMDKYDLSSDPCDNQIIRFNNFMQMLACICEILACIEPAFRDLADIIGCIADLVFIATASCMNAQGHYEITERAKTGDLAPVAGGLSGSGAVAGYAQAPKADTMAHQQAYAQQPVYAAAVVAPPQQRTFMVIIPDNVYPGTQLQVQTPEGQTVMFAVPPGAVAGQQVMVPY